MEVVRNENDGLAKLADDAGKFLLKCGTGQGIKRSKGFIKQQQIGISNKRSCNAKALPLAAGKFVRKTGYETLRLKSDKLKHFGNSVFDSCTIAAGKPQGEADILRGGHMRK